MSNVERMHTWLDSASDKAPGSSCYETDSMPSIDFGYDSEDNRHNRNKSKSTTPEDLDSLDIIDVMGFISDMAYLLCALGKYIRPDDKDKTSFNNKVDELIDLLYELPQSRGLQRMPDYKSVVKYVTELKNELNAMRGL